MKHQGVLLNLNAELPTGQGPISFLLSAAGA